MKIKITSKEYNPLLKRKEVVFEVDHRAIGRTPTRLEAKKTLATTLKTNLELVYVKKMETKTGLMVAIGQANVYDNADNAKLVEPHHIIARNMPPEKQVEEVAEKTEENVEKIAKSVEMESG